MRGGRVPSRKDPSTLPKIHTVNLSTGLPQRDLQPLARVTAHWEKGNNQTFRVPPDTGSELMLIPKDPKLQCGQPVRRGVHGDQVTNVFFPLKSVSPWAQGIPESIL